MADDEMAGFDVEQGIRDAYDEAYLGTASADDYRVQLQAARENLAAQPENAIFKFEVDKLVASGKAALRREREKSVSRMRVCCRRTSN